MKDLERYCLGKPVRSLQVMLRRIADCDSRVLPVIPDGVFGPNTYAAVCTFQQTQDLPVTGAVDAQTWKALALRHGEIAPANSRPCLLPAWSFAQALQPGDAHLHLFLVQGLLGALGQCFPDIPRPALTGVLDSPTQAGLRVVQRAGGCPDSGVLDTETWNQLLALYGTLIGPG